MAVGLCTAPNENVGRHSAVYLALLLLALGEHRLPHFLKDRSDATSLLRWALASLRDLLPVGQDEAPAREENLTVPEAPASFNARAGRAWSLVAEPYARFDVYPYARLWVDDLCSSPHFRHLGPPRRGTAAPRQWGRSFLAHAIRDNTALDVPLPSVSFVSPHDARPWE